MHTADMKTKDHSLNEGLILHKEIGDGTTFMTYPRPGSQWQLRDGTRPHSRETSWELLNDHRLFGRTSGACVTV